MGPAGTPGILNVRIVTATQVATLGSTMLTGQALCSASEVVLSGGFSISDEAHTSAKVVENAPVDFSEGEGRGWVTSVQLEGGVSPKKQAPTLTIYAVCAEMAHK